MLMKTGKFFRKFYFYILWHATITACQSCNSMLQSNFHEISNLLGGLDVVDDDVIASDDRAAAAVMVVAADDNFVDDVIVLRSAPGDGEG